MKKILLLTDFSDNALNAITYALQFFESKKCKFYVMHVHKAKGYVTDELLVSPKNSIHDSIIVKPKAKLKALVTKLKNDYTGKDFQFEALIDFDIFTDAINQAVKKLEIDYVVMGSNGVSDVKEIIFGSNTINVIEKVHCKTLVVPSDYKFLPVHEFLVSLQPKDSLYSTVFNDILDFISDFDLHLHVLRIAPKHNDANIVLQDKERLALLDAKYHLVEDVPMDYVVSSYLQTNAIDITAFIAKDKSLLKRIFSASPSKELKLRLKLPLLVLHSH